MAYEPLHHKYRPQTFAQLVGQGAIATTLSNALQQNRIAPAYLFCGPRGTGKTSSARILAKSLNCLSSDSPTSAPCGTCQVCREITVGASLDIIEIDAASNTGVDNIRELIERAQFAPVQCRHKLYVLDEVHMLSTAAFNALLKTLEEPPPHVVFVLATTDPQRVLPTIISRCQRFDFRRIPLDAMVQHLTYIAQQESIAIAPDALQLVAQLSQGGLRDAESLLDQLGLLDGEITIEAVWDLVGAVSERELLALVQAVGADDGAQVIILARQLMDRGREPLMVLQSLVAFYRDLLIAKTAGERRDLVAITPSIWSEMVAFAKSLSLPLLLSSQQHLRAAEVQVKNTTQPRLWLEITLMGLLPSALGQASVTAPKLSPLPSNVAAAISAKPPITPSAPRLDTPPTRATQVSPTDDIADTQISADKADDIKDVEAKSAGATIEDEAKSAAMSAPAPASVPMPSNDAPAIGSLSDIWGKIVAQLTPMGTQVLMRQHGQLVACDGVEARVGITNDKLMRMAQDRLSNVEAAFEKVFGHKIRVTMVVATAEPSTSSQESDEKPLPSAPPSTLPAVAKPVITADPPPSDPTLSAAAPLNVDSSASPSQAQPSAQNNPPPIAKWQESSELDRSVKSFAQFFNGQIVNLDDEGTDAPKPSTEPGPDVPF
ncbi:MAG: DNA polymerase III subunit gamma/tau [Cyanobacteria bacterium P01_H01_bin.21]